MDVKTINIIRKKGRIPLDAMRILLHIVEFGSLSTRDIRQKTGIAKSSVGRYLRILTQKEFIMPNKETIPYKWALTEKGKKILQD